MSTVPSSPRLSYTSRDFANVLSDLQAYVAATRPDLQTDFVESGLGTALLETIALVGDQVAFGQDSVASEVFLATCRRYESALRFCRSVGYVPRPAAAASVVVTAAAVPSALAAAGGTIAAGSFLARPDGVRYQLLSAVGVPTSATAVTLMLTEGTSYGETTDPAFVPRLTVTTSQGVVASGSWEVTVGPDVWAEVDNVALEADDTQTYSVDFTGDGRLVIQFGDGTAGAIPAASVTVAYRTTAGAAGNATPLSIAGNVRASLTGGGNVNLSFSNPASATGGADRESLEDLRVSVPAYVRTGGVLTTIADYDAGPRRVAGVGLSYADFAYQSYAANVVNVSVWGTEDVTFAAESTDGTVTSVAPYRRYAPADSTLAGNVQAYLRDRTQVGILPVILTPGVAWVDLYLRQVVVDSRSAFARTHAAVAAAVVGVFQSGDGFSVRLSSLYAALRSVPGVRYFSLDRAVFEYAAKGRATGAVSFTAGLQPPDGATLRVNDGTGTYVFEFDSNNVLAGGTVKVAIGAGASDTMNNLIAAVNAAGASVVAVRASGSTPSMNLTQTLGGTSFNVPIVVTGTGNVTASGMSGGTDTLSTVREDRRADPYGTAWPPGTYAPGAPFTSGVWQDGGLQPYKGLGDLVIPLDRLARPYYAEATVFNNEVVFNAGPALSASPQGVNLRRLVIDLVTAGS